MYKPKNKWIITFEGSSDCTGKTTLINEFNKVTNYSHLLRDRGTLFRQELTLENLEEKLKMIFNKLKALLIVTHIIC